MRITIPLLTIFKSGECVDVEKPTKKNLKRKLAESDLAHLGHPTNLEIRPNYHYLQVIQPNEEIRLVRTAPPSREVSGFPSGLLENILKEVQKLGKTTIQLKEEQETLKRELKQWSLAEENNNDAISVCDEEDECFNTTSIPQKRQRHELSIVPSNHSAMMEATVVFPPLIVQTSRKNSEFVIKDPLKPFAVLRPRFSGPEFQLFPVTANAPMSELLGFTEGDDKGSYDCTRLVPGHVPANAVARAEMFTNFVKRSTEPHSAIMHRSITYCTKDGRYIDADTRKQFFYNENGEPMFVIVCVDKVYIPSHYVYHLTETNDMTPRFQLDSSSSPPCDGSLPQEGDVSSSPNPSPVQSPPTPTVQIQQAENMGDINFGEDLFALLDFYQGFTSN